MIGYLQEIQMIEAMLHQGNKRIISCLILCVISFGGCNKYKTYNVKEIKEIREKSIAKAQSIIGENEYMKIYILMNDSVNNWKSHNLGYYKYMGVSKDYLIDSVLCVNEKGNKIITTILQQQLLEDGVQDDIWYFYGVKINNQWYFFAGATLVLPREFYQEDIHTPLSFEKLKQIAKSNIYRGYLKKGKKGQWEINERFFDGISNKNSIGGGYGSCFECQTEKEYYLYLVNKQWEDHRKAEQKAIEEKKREEIMERYLNSLKNK
jgi:hypothetical protein